MPQPYATTDANGEDFLAAFERRANQTFEVGDLVRLIDDVGTKAQRKQVWRVTRTPDPTARKKALREAYGLEPAEGGTPLSAGPDLLDPASDADKARYANVTPVARMVVGQVAVSNGANFPGCGPDDRFVVINENTDGTVRLAKLGGDGGRYFPKVRPAMLRPVEV